MTDREVLEMVLDITKKQLRAVEAGEKNIDELVCGFEDVKILIDTQIELEPESGVEKTGVVMPFGKHKGQDIAETPKDYLQWLYKSRGPKDWRQDDPLKAAIEDVLELKAPF